MSLLHSRVAKLFGCLLVLITASLSTDEVFLNDDGDSGPLSTTCLSCICEVVGCKVRSPPACSGESCSLFSISYGYWSDAFSRTGAENYNDYVECVRSWWCAARTVQHHMRRYLPECVRKSGARAPCETALALHYRGPRDCRSPLDDSATRALHACLDRRVRAWLAPNSIPVR